MVIAAALIGLATAMFVGEVCISAGIGRPLHNWKDTLAALAMQAGTGFVSHFGKLLLLALYAPLYGELALFAWNGSPIAWFGAFLAYDFVGYWFHRFSHRTNLGWAIHVVHHQSEELNLATAMRTAPLRSLLDWPTLLPLALLGIPPHVLMALYVLHAAGQYWLHVKWIPKLGPLGWVLNTPSHHRVHHGCQAGYQDANYGAHLIVFDRLFGTFTPETAKPHYGVTRPVAGWDPLRAIVEPFAVVWRDAQSWSAFDRLQIWLRPPGWRPIQTAAHGRPPPPRADLRPARLGSALWHTAETSVLLLSVQAPALEHPAQYVGLGGLGLWSLWAQGRLLEDRLPHLASELLRAFVMAGFAVLLPPLLGGTVVVLAIVSAGSSLVHWRQGATRAVSAAAAEPSQSHRGVL